MSQILRRGVEAVRGHDAGELHRYRGARAVIVCAGCLRLGVAVVAAGNGIVVSADDVDPVRRLRTGKRGDDVDDLDGLSAEPEPPKLPSKKRREKEEDESQRLKRIMAICAGC